MSAREEGRSYALPERPGKQIDERQHIVHDNNESKEDHRGECALWLNGLTVRDTEVLATADEVERSFRIFS